MKFKDLKFGWETLKQVTHDNISIDLPQCINNLHVLMLMGICFYSWRLKVLVFAHKEVEGFCFCSWRLKVLVFALREVEDFCFCFWMFKIFVVSFECWRFLFILLDVEGFDFTFWCERLLLLLLDVQSSYF